MPSRILGGVAIEQGYDVKVSEVHGMSQRGGSVVTYVKFGEFGEKVYSPIVGEKTADYIMAFENLEAYRYLPYLKENGKLLVNAQEIDPMPVILGSAKYPENILTKIKDKNASLCAVDAFSAAREAAAKRRSMWCSSACSRP